MVKHLSYLLNPKLNTHELDKETFRLTHDHLEIRFKRTKVYYFSIRFFNINYGVPKGSILESFYLKVH